MSGGGPSWAGGYVVDVPYVNKFHPGLAPINLAFAAALAGVRPPDVDGSFACLDLGCGNGFTPALLGAVHPKARMWGNDFNPDHIRNARATAAAAEVGNVTFLEASFADLLDADLPTFDIVVAHGIWSWVSAENRAIIIELLARAVKPGGLVLVSYNCHPGWDALLPFRRLLATAGGEGTSVQRMERALATARQLSDAGAAYFRDTPAASALLAQLEAADPAYLVHEFLNTNWTIFHPEEVAGALAGAGLRYLCQARIGDALDRVCFTPEQQALIADADGAQGVRDLILNRRFRSDLFVRGDDAREGAAAWFERRPFVLARARADCVSAIEAADGRAIVPDVPFAALLDALAAGPATAGALAARVGASLEAVRDTLAMLVAAGDVLPALSAGGEGARRVASDRFNAAALNGVRMGEPAPALASPVAGTGVQLPASDQFLLDAVQSGVPADLLQADGDDPQRFDRSVLPRLRMLGMA